MAYKFSAGQSVEFQIATGTVGLFEVVRQMPEEDRFADRYYRIMSVDNKSERIVMEEDLSLANSRTEYAPAPKSRSLGRK